jgi:hypothetical protein
MRWNNNKGDIRMMIKVKTIQKVFAIIIFMAVALACHPLLAFNGAFTHYPIKELKLVEVNVRTGTVILQSPDGETAVFSFGDVVGQENFEITAICKKGVTLECSQDDPARKRKGFIPAVQISDELVPIQSVPHTTGRLKEGLPPHF